MSEDRPTRTRLLDTLKGAVPLPVRALSAALAITPMAVRQHLVVLERDGLVRRAIQKRAIGRPQSVYTLTPAARHLFPDRHASLACELLEQVRESLGPQGLDHVLQERLARQRDGLQARVQGGNVRLRLSELASIQDAAGFMATSDPVRGELIQRHCTICAAAERFPQLCAMEQQLFEAVLGVPVERIEHVLRGGAVCRYRVAVPPAERPATGKRRPATARGRRTAARGPRRGATGKEARP